MKRVFFYLLPLIIILIASCSDDSGGTITDPFGSGSNSGTGNVTFSMSTANGQQGIIFIATPSVSVKITKVTVSLPAQQFIDVIEDDGSSVFNANEGVQIEEYTGVASGQQWTFKFEGTLANGGQAFNVTTNYTIP